LGSNVNDKLILIILSDIKNWFIFWDKIVLYFLKSMTIILGLNSMNIYRQKFWYEDLKIMISIIILKITVKVFINNKTNISRTSKCYTA
jgi:hypothetical protein